MPATLQANPSTPISSVNNARKPPHSPHLPTPATFMAQQSKWNDGYPDGLDMLPSLPTVRFFAVFHTDDRFWSRAVGFAGNGVAVNVHIHDRSAPRKWSVALHSSFLSIHLGRSFTATPSKP
ncbi:hypothetical protein AVEN_94300-1 [Araneus ventricosus]|uniref:Uncharacterized protein n=1 Tax=Araneus ventricosus TaxID=182803 RepID=A0A4Y2I7Z7_ARAVE|nr:hypothetical protein AVEN_94300-1 [Araneus ventricosus]